MNFLQLKDAFDFNKDKTIHLSKRFYIDVYVYYYTKVSIYDNEISECNKAIAQIIYNIETNIVLVFLRDDGILSPKNKVDYSLMDSIDRLELNLPPELIQSLKKYGRRKLLWKIRNKINLVLKKDKI